VHCDYRPVAVSGCVVIKLWTVRPNCSRSPPSLAVWFCETVALTLFSLGAPALRTPPSIDELIFLYPGSTHELWPRC
jgi:hypothetical protein